MIAVVVVFGGSTHAATVDECPVGTVPVDAAVCIDRYEWPNVHGERPLIGASAEPEERDVERGETWDAVALCASVGKRVCTLREWVGACRGDGGARYPWGDRLPRFTPGERALPCNADRRHRGVRSEVAIYRRDPVEFARLDQREPSGARDCVSASGAVDMVGNVEEWVRCPGVGRYGWCLMGRFWAEPRSCEYAVTVHAPRWHYYNTGFRCCLDRSWK